MALLLLLAVAAGRLLDAARPLEIAPDFRHRHTSRCLPSNHEIVNDRHHSCRPGHPFCRPRGSKSCGGTPAIEEAAPKAKQSLAAYIQNGANAKYGEWPFYVVVQVGDLPGIKSGVLISNQHVLILATSVVYELPDKWPNVNVTEVFKPHRIKVLLGEHNLDKEDEGEQVAPVKSLIVSEKFSMASREHDWALLELEQPIEQFTNYIQPACLPMSPVRHAGDLSDCYLVGAGKGDGNSGDDKQVQQVRVQQVVCPDELAIEDSDESRECYAAWPRERANICRGDMGAPVFCRNSQDRWTLMALRKGANSEEDLSSGCLELTATGSVLVATKLELLLPDIFRAADGN